jgi:hypothetical protein
MKQTMTAEQFIAQHVRGTPKLARGRTAGATHKAMNQTERAYAARLDYMLSKGEILAYSFHTLRIVLADRSWYTPDFLVQMPDASLEIHEVKGWATEQHALLQLKWAAQIAPWFTFRSFTKIPQKDGGGWKERTFESTEA